MLNAILFDLDGTLVDTDTAHFAIWQRLLADRGLTIDLDFYKARVSGRTNAQILADILPELSEAEAVSFSELKERQFRESANLERLTGLDRLLAWCRDREIRRAVVTNAPRDNAIHMLDVLGLMAADHRPEDNEFETLVLAEELPRGKPFPDPYLEGLRRLGTVAAETIAFEDTPTGVQSAVAAGLTTLGVRTTYDAETLTVAGATLTIAHFDDPQLWSWLEIRSGTPGRGVVQ